ncbi:Multidrug resistance-associated protein 1 [Phlyctochytrium planicorne]|nr:Multidrug resistance-associated protein 1 [Phlyctochytrium planicorne]
MSTTDKDVQQKHDPIAITNSTSQPSPRGYMSAGNNPWSFITLSYLNKMMYLSIKRPLEAEDIPLLKTADTAEHQATVLQPFTASVEEYLKTLPSPSEALTADPDSKDKKKSTSKPAGPSFFKVIWTNYGIFFYFALIAHAFAIASSIYTPLVLQDVIRFVQGLPTSYTPTQISESKIGLAIWLFVAYLLKVVGEPTMIQLIRTFQFRAYGLIRAAIFQKALRLSTAASKEFNEGRVLSMVNVDADQLSNAMLSATDIILLPIQIAATIFFLVKLIGSNIYPAAIVMITSLVLAVPLMGAISAYMKSYMEGGDARVKFIREILTNIKYVKFRAEEMIRMADIDAKREKQLAALKKFLLAVSVVIVLFILPPTLMPIASILLYSKSTGGIIDPAVVFPTLILFAELFQPLQGLPNSLSSVLTGMVSLKRIQSFLLAEERPPHQIASAPSTTDSDNAIEIKGGSFKWEEPLEDGDAKKQAEAEKKKAEKQSKKKKKPKKGDKLDDKEDVSESATELKIIVEDTETAKGEAELKKNDDAVEEKPKSSAPLFQDLNLTIPKSKLTAIVGPVGAGKSSIFSAILGDMTSLTADPTIHLSPNTHIAYCQQQPWLQSASIRENILFGTPQDDARLDAVIEACDLNSDLKTWADGLDTEIGEKGILLSGGQKARVALARAMYSPTSNLLLLDDPLSALDSQVGKKVFQSTLLSLAATKTRVLVTHQLFVLPSVDWVVVMDEGKVLEQGNFEELMAKDEGKLKDMMKEYQRDHSDKSDAKSTASGSTAIGALASTPVPTPAELNLDDDSSIQSPANVEDSDPKKPRALMQDEDREKGALKLSVIKFYLEKAGGSLTTVSLLTIFLFFTGSNAMIDLWISWWGDLKFGWLSEDYFKGYAAFGVVNVILILSMSFILAAGGLGASRKMHREAIRGLMAAPMSFFDGQPIGRILNRLSKDLEDVDKQIWLVVLNYLFGLSSILSNIASLTYATPYSLIAFFFLLICYFFFLKMYRCSMREIKRIVSTERSPLNAHISECLGGVVSLRAFEAEERMILLQRTFLDRSNGPTFAQFSVRIWLDLRIQFFSSLIILFVTILGLFTPGYPASLIGLSVQVASSLTRNLSVFVLFTAALESEMVSVERLLHYCTRLPKEAPAKVVKEDPKEGEEWPKQGALTVKNLVVKYASMDEPVIKGIDIDIKGGEKIGVVGRTGSGKSTFLTALFRLVEPQSGSIILDGKDVLRMGLQPLRSNLQIIPQEPVLFTGTIRSNLDPNKTFTDDQLWTSLDQVGLKPFISSKDAKLDHPVEENGSNLSMGQRQLLILARSLCSNPKVLVMDEASSSVDVAADALIQDSIKTFFKDSTVISIAHRLNTVADFDRVLVLDKGVVVEFDTPARLLRNGDGVFRKMVDATGVANAHVITQIAEEHERNAV